MTKKKLDFIENILAVLTILGIFGLFMYNDIVLRKTGIEIPYPLTMVIIIFVIFIVSIVVIGKIKKQRFGEAVLNQSGVTWKAFLRNFIIIMFSNRVTNKSHSIAKSARNGMILVEEAVTDIITIYGLFFVLFFTVFFTLDYFSKKKAGNIYIANE